MPKTAERCLTSLDLVRSKSPLLRQKGPGRFNHIATNAFYFDRPGPTKALLNEMRFI